MEVTSETFLAILKSSLLGQKANLDKEIIPDDWQRLFSMASIHSVLPMFYEAVYASPSLQQVNAPFVAMAKRQVMQQVMMQTMRTNEFLELNKRLHAAGVRPLVIKGIICRNLYPQPDYRQSGDEDVLILKNHGVICVSDSLKEAMLLAVFVEETAKTQFITIMLNSAEDSN